MSAEGGEKFSVIFAGVGGQGALTFGQYLAEAAANKYLNVTFFPVYAPVMRGGDTECTVVASNTRIASPVPTFVETAVVTSPAKLQQAEGRVRSGGLLMIDSSVVAEKARRQDRRALYVPAARIASEKLGEPMVTNFLLMGVYLETTKVLPLELMERTIEMKLRGTPKEKMLSLNLQALWAGAVLGSQSNRATFAEEVSGPT